MTAEKVFGKLKEIIKGAGLEEMITIGTHVNELADCMLYESENDREILFASNGIPLVPFSSIRNVLYLARKTDNDEQPSLISGILNTSLVVQFELELDATLTFEFGDDDGWEVSWLMVGREIYYETSNDRGFSYEEAFKRYREAYWKKYSIRDVALKMIANLADHCDKYCIAENEKATLDAIEEYLENYVQKSEFYKEILLEYAYVIYMSGDDDGLAPAKEFVINKFKQHGWEQELFDYLSEHLFVDDDPYMTFAGVMSEVLDWLSD